MLSPHELMHSHLSTPDAVLHCKDRILGNLHKLTHQGQVRASLGKNLRSITSLPREELRSDVRQHARDGHDTLGELGREVQMSEEFSEDLLTGALGHWLLDKISYFGRE